MVQTDDEVCLMEELFTFWNTRPEWDTDTNGSHPGHLPIHDDQFPLDPVPMTDSETGGSVTDYVPHILKGMAGKIDALIHCHTVFRTPAIKCTWFSCCREFLSVIIGSLLGKHANLLLNLLHLIGIHRSS